jgi:hypothetical protein
MDIMLEKDDSILKKLEGLSEKECLQWFVDNFDITHNEAVHYLAVARGEDTFDDVLAFDESGNRIYEYLSHQKNAANDTDDNSDTLKGH